MSVARPHLLARVLAPLQVGLALALAAPAGALQLDEATSYPVSQFVLEYALDHPDQFPIHEIFDLEVGLRATEDGYQAPRPVDRTVRMRISSLPRDARFFPSAIRHITQYVVATFNRRGIDGVIVTVPDIDETTGTDLRAPGHTALRLRIWTGRIADVSTFADGERFASLSDDRRTNHPSHTWMREDSPARPGGEKDLLRVAALEDYTAFLSRHPGRRVEAELAPGAQPGTTRVNYRVVEQRPWSVYGQISNTGTDATTTLRERFGFTHNQLTRRDDVLRVDYVTGNFSEVHGLFGSYEAPFALSHPQWRLRASGWWSEYRASEVGFTLTDFDGTQWSGGGDLVWNAFQRGPVFVDLEAGARWQHVESSETLNGRDGSEDFFLPRVGMSVRRDTSTSSLSFELEAERNISSVAGTKSGPDGIDALGRIDADEDAAVLLWRGRYAFYLEPLIDAAGWHDPATPVTSTLAHEIEIRTKGQHALGNRLAPWQQQVAGGLYTVRGYEQSEAAGDNVYLGSLQYGFHVPRILAPEDPVDAPILGAFRTHPPHVYGLPDWDLVLRAFLDAGRVEFSDPLGFERDENLVSGGVGIDLNLLRNLSLRLDVGIPFTGLDDTGALDPRVHFAGTLIY